MSAAEPMGVNESNSESSINTLITDNIDIWTGAVKRRSASGRGSSKKIVLTGVKKLRELILELAVRGRLVPQDSTDEPASVLLEKIAAEKAQLIKDKKIKKQKVLPAITEGEKPFRLPDGWEWVRLGNISEIGPRNVVEDNVEVSFVPMPLISTSYNGAHGQENRLWSEIKKGYTHFADGDIGLAKITPCFENSKAAVFSGLNNGIGTGTTELHIARPFGETLDRLFVLLYLKAPQFLLVGETKMIGSAGQKRVPKSFFAENPLPLPPLAEQHRIVAKVDELMLLCDALEQETEASLAAHQTLVETLLATLTIRHASTASDISESEPWALIEQNFDVLFTTEQSIDSLKQTILQLAVMGKLVPQNPDDQPAANLLEKIAIEKAQLIKDKKIKKQKALPAITEDEKPFGLPVGWEWCYVWDVSNLITSGSRGWAKYYSDTGSLFITMGNLSRGSYKLRMDSLRYVNPPTEGEGARTKLEENDLLISITGDVGNLGLIPANFGDAYINQHTCLLRFMPDCRNRYFPELMRSPLAKYQFDAPQRGIKNSFRLGDIGEMIIPVPPLPEQHRIVTKVDQLMTICDQLKAQLGEAQTSQCHLADAVVSQAVN